LHNSNFRSHRNRDHHTEECIMTLGHERPGIRRIGGREYRIREVRLVRGEVAGDFDPDADSDFDADVD
jgi:hypothetical protein